MLDTILNIIKKSSILWERVHKDLLLDIYLSGYIKEKKICYKLIILEKRKAIKWC